MVDKIQETQNHLARVIGMIEAIPAAEMDEEDREVSEGLLAMAGAHQNILLHNEFAALSEDDRARHLDNAQKFCDEVTEVMALAGAQGDAAVAPTE